VPIAIFIIKVLQYFSYRKFIQFAAAILISISWIGQGHTVIMRNDLFHHPLLLWKDNTAKAPGFSRTHNNLGMAYWELGRYDEALSEYKAALIAPRYQNKSMLSMSRYNMGLYHLYVSHDPGKAREFFEQAIRINREHEMSRPNLVMALIRLGEDGRAMEQVEAALNLWPKMPELQSLYSLILLRKGEIQQALRVASRAFSYNPEMIDLQVVIGECHRRLGNYTAARKHWQAVLRQRPRNEEAAFALLFISDCLKDKSGLSSAAIHLLQIKGDRSWDTFFRAYHKKTVIRAFPDGQIKLIPLIRRGVDQSMNSED
jgi:tetratricopeptide (TPR) repeat protein